MHFFNAVTLIPIPMDGCKLFLCTPEQIQTLLASKRRLIELQ